MSDASQQSHEIPLDILAQIFRLLPQNEIVCICRLLCKGLASLLQDKKTVQLSQLVPQPEFARLLGSEQFLEGLTYVQRLKLIQLTAFSGSATNLELAIAAAGCELTPQSRDSLLQSAARGGHMAIVLKLLQLPSAELLLALRDVGGAGEVKDHNSKGLDNSDGDSDGGPGWHSIGEQKLGGLRATLAVAAGAGHWDLCHVLVAAGVAAGFDRRAWQSTITKGAFAATTSGRLDLALWLLREGTMGSAPSPLAGLLKAGAYGLDLPDLKRLGESHLVLWGAESPRMLVRAAVASPHLDWEAKVQYLLVQTGSRTYSDDWGTDQDSILVSDFQDRTLVEGAFERPDAFERVSFLHNHGFLHVHDLLESAICKANLVILQMAIRLYAGQPKEVRHTYQALETGNLEVLEQLLGAGWPIDGRAITAMVKRGHLHMLQRLAGPEAGPGCMAAWREAMQSAKQLVLAAAEVGNMGMMEWLQAHGCPHWDAEVFAAAAKSGKVALLRLMVERGCPMEDSAYLQAGLNGDFTTLHCLHQLGCPWDPAGSTFSRAVNYDPDRSCMGCSLPVLQWMHRQGCPVDWDEARQQATVRAHCYMFKDVYDNSDIEILRWLNDPVYY